jgi:hypothetical protein
VLTIVNRAPFLRRQWVTIQVPQDIALTGWRRIPGVMAAYVGNETGRVTNPLYLLLDLAPGEYRQIPSLGEPVEVPAVIQPPSSWVTDDIGALLPEFDVMLPDGITGRPVLQIVSAVHDGPRQRWHLRGRVPGSMLVLEARYEIFAGQDLVPLTLALTNGDPSRPEFDQPILGISVATGEYWHLHHAARLGAAAEPVRIGNRWHRPLLGPTTIGDGQRIIWRGTLLCAPSNPQELHLPGADLRVSTFQAERAAPLTWGLFTQWGTADWPLPPFGVRPKLPAGADLDRAVNEAVSYLTWPGNVWDARPWGCAKSPGQTGGQQDFGAVRGDAAWYRPEILPFLAFCAEADGLRPHHYREMDGSPYRKAQHPQCCMWDGRPDSRFSPDMLGKNPSLPRERHGWGGYDRQHFSINNLYAAAILTGDATILALLDDLAEVYLSSDTVPSEPGCDILRGMDAPRAVGRTFQSVCQIHLATGRDDVLERARKRMVEVVAQQWHGRRHEGDPSRPVKPMATISDPRVLQVEGKPVEAIMVWQEGIAAMGLHALAQLEPSALAVLEPVVRTVVDHCYAQDSNGLWVTADAIGYDDGKAKPEWQNVTSPYFHRTGWFEEWVLPAALILDRMTNGQHERARAIVAQAGDTVTNWDQAGWRACV